MMSNKKPNNSLQCRTKKKKKRKLFMRASWMNMKYPTLVTINFFLSRKRTETTVNALNQSKVFLVISISTVWCVNFYLVSQTLNYLNDIQMNLLSLWVFFLSFSFLFSVLIFTHPILFVNTVGNSFSQKLTHLGCYGWLSIARECIWWVVHYTSVIVFNAVSCGRQTALFIEICLRSFDD